MAETDRASVNNTNHEVPPTPAAEAAGEPPQPRVWPVFVAFVAILSGILVGSIVLVITLVILERGTLSPPDELEASVQNIALRAPVIIGTVALSVFLLSSSSLFGSVLSPQRLRERLRFRTPSVPFLAYPTSILGLLVVGQLLEYVAAWLGVLDGTTALELLAEAIRGMTGSAFAIFLLVASLGAGIAEELFFRGYMQTRLTERWGVGIGIVATSIAFAILHFDPVHSSVAFFMGLYLGWLAELSRSIVLPMAAHVGNNLVALAATRLTEGSLEVSAIGVAASAVLAILCILVLKRLAPRTDQPTQP